MSDGKKTDNPVDPGRETNAAAKKGSGKLGAILLVALVLCVLAGGFICFRVIKSLRQGVTDTAESKKTALAESEIAPDIQTIQLPGEVTLDMVKVASGSFEMSRKDKSNFSDEKPHTVKLENDFYIGRTEVTQAQWRAVMGVKKIKKGEEFEEVEAGKARNSCFVGGELPVETVTWDEAMAFCAKLNEMGAAPAGWRFTLPTESQWEYAARGGKKDRQCKFSGSDELEEVGWYGDSKPEEGAREHQGTTHRVALKKANELGLYDMSGNVWEWTLDDYVGDSSQLKNPELRHVISGSAEVTKKCPTCAHASTVREEVGCQFRTVRGGSWSKGERHCRNAQRYYYNAAYATNYIGFRVVLVKATPTEIAQMAIDALKKQDIDAVIALAHGKAQEELKAHAKKFAELKKAAADGDEEKKATLAKIQGMLDKISLTVKGGEIDGDRAVVDIERKLDGEIGADKIYLKKIDGVWKLVDESEFSAAK